MSKYKKLVRDRIPEIIRENGEDPVVHKLSQAEYKRELLKKLVEEAKEAAATKDKKQLLSELADLYEVGLTLMEVFGIERRELTKERNAKKRKRGAFTKRIYLEGVK